MRALNLGLNLSALTIFDASRRGFDDIFIDSFDGFAAILDSIVLGNGGKFGGRSGEHAPTRRHCEEECRSVES